ncbi:leucine-rich repeat domain-containing protein [Ulvibacter antarcticus]|uniref:Leucine rich repeat (LRR) protein n=1 Tax=Ulvibacter antarcticus TaxID=442714 RepID=A0A3L9YET8_9FLAO|nr:Two component regulator three Y domain protein [Ulvibacter antarcticus]RMA58904.1 leucine rich repeat (LRR) protein [Ulvibacter antarcticus]
MKKFLITSAFAFSAFLVTAQVSEQQKEALLDIYVATQGENWVNTWDVNQPVDQWYGVLVKNDKVVSLNLMFNNMVGSLPSSISNLTDLQTLELSFNELNGEIPAAIGDLNELKLLALNGNNLTGNIPASLGNVQTLTELHLSSNQLEGQLPTSLSNLTKLELLNVFDNKLTGTLPLGLAHSKNLQQIVIAENEIIDTEGYASLLLFKSETEFKNSNPLNPSAKTIIASETSDDEN